MWAMKGPKTLEELLIQEWDKETKKCIEHLLVHFIRIILYIYLRFKNIFKVVNRIVPEKSYAAELLQVVI